jgi:integrase/recombinase XerD
MSRWVLKEALERYLVFGRDHRGLAERTREQHGRWLNRLIGYLRGHGIRETRRITIGAVDGFLQKLAANGGLGSVDQAVGSVRQFFRYLALEGVLNAHMAGQVASPCRFQDDQRPKYFPWEKIEVLLKSVDRGKRVGKRDFAILALMAHLGLRAREVGALRLEDVRWESRSVFIRERKNARSAHLPMSLVVEEALRDYLGVRPKVAFAEVFVTAPGAGPDRALGGCTYSVARRHLERCFGPADEVPRGAYTLRHSFAKALLDKGAPLPQISQLLGHTSVASTLAYTRVATTDMREVADNYADLL